MPAGPSASPASRRALSAREAEVLAMVSLGLSNGEIAGRLGVTVHAVKFHLAAIYRKLGVANRTEAVAVTMRAGSGDPASAIGAEPR